MESGSSDRCSRPFDLARLIAPVDVETFTTAYWERQPLVVQARTPSYYDELLSLADTDHVLMHSSIRSQDVRIVRAGQETSYVPSPDDSRVTCPEPPSSRGPSQWVFAVRVVAMRQLLLLSDAFQGVRVRLLPGWGQ